MKKLFSLKKIKSRLIYHTSLYKLRKFFKNNTNFRNMSNRELQRTAIWYTVSMDINYSLYKGLNLWGIDSLTDDELKEVAIFQY